MNRTNVVDSLPQSLRPVGDDYSASQIQEWYLEEEGYSDKFTSGRAPRFERLYEVCDDYYAFNRHFKPTKESRVLSFGCAEGNDLERFYARYGFELFGIDASASLIEVFKRKFPKGIVRKANILGQIDFDDNYFDYVTALAVLHHIPNVTYVLGELARVLKPNGTIIIKESISTMRPKGRVLIKEGLSPRERGCSKEFYLDRFERYGLFLVDVKYAGFPPLTFLAYKTGMAGRVPHIMFGADFVLSQVMGRYASYQRETLLQRCMPGSAYFVCRKK